VKPSDHERNDIYHGAPGGPEKPTHANEPLEGAGRWLRSVFENSPEIVKVVDPDGTLRYASPAFGRALGYDPKEAVGTNVFDYVHPDDLARVLEGAEKALLGDSVGGSLVEYRFRHKDGSWRWMEGAGTYLPDAPDVEGVVVNARDITERKEAERALRESERRFSSVVSNAHAYAYRCLNEPGWPNEYASDYALELTGYPPEDLIVGGKVQLGDLIVEEDRRRVWDEVQEALAGGRGFELRYAIRRRDGQIRHVHEFGRGVFGEDGGVVALEGLLYDVTGHKEAEEALKESEERYRAVMEQSVEAIYLFDAETKRVLESNAAFRRLMGYAEEELLGMRIYDFIDHDDEDIARHVRRSLKEKRRHIGERRYRRKDDSVILVDTSASVISYGGRMTLCAISRDVTERREAEEVVRKSEVRLAEVQRLAHLGGWEWDVRTDEIFWSDEVYRIYGLAPGSSVPSYEGFMAVVHPDDREMVGKAIDGALNESKPYDVEHRVVRPDGEVRMVHRRAEVVRGEGGEPLRMIGTVHDITERRALEERLEHQALHDSLTGLPNRQLFVDRLEQALRRIRRRRGRKVGVLFMDLDGFKVINDSLGHDTGDRLLVEMTKRLGRCLRPEDTLARFGGDEFTVLIEDVEVSDAALRVAERIVEELREPFSLEGRELYVAASIGVGLGSDGMKGSEELLREADTAMYRAKDEGLGYKVFDSAMHGRAVSRLQLENDFRRAIEENEFVVHYQPIVNLQTGSVWGMEALVRWEHPERGLLDPDEFVPMAEESGLVVPMGELVLEEACRRAVEWQREIPRTPPLAMSVNLSGRQLRRPDLHEVIERALKESGLSASSLGMDITETVYISALDANTAALDRLRALGIRISLDDFGSGYSSLSYLKRLPADILKIDKSFTKGLGVEIEDTAIVQTFVDLAHILGMEVVAEGVEIEEQETLLREMGCDFAQGFYRSKPLPPHEVSRFLSE